MLVVFLRFFSGNLLVQLIPVLITPLLYSLYSKASIADLGIVISYSNLLSMICTTRLELALMKIQGRLELQHALCCLIFIIFSITVLVVGAYFLIAYLAAFEVSQTVVACIIIIAFGVSFHKVCVQYWLKIGALNRASFSKFFITLLCVILQLALFQYPDGLMLGLAASWLISVAFLIKATRSKKTIEFTFKNLSWFIKRNSAIVKYEFPADLVNFISNQLLYYLLPLFYGKEYIAGYFLIERLVLAPINLLASSLGNVYYKFLCEKSTGKVFLTIKLLILLLSILLLPLLVFANVGDYLFLALFPGDWSELENIFKYVSAFALLVILTAPFSTVFVFFNEQKKLLKYTLLSLCFRSLVVFSCYFSEQAVNDTIIAFLISSIVLRLYLLFVILKIIIIETNTSLLQLQSILKKVFYSPLLKGLE